MTGNIFAFKYDGMSLTIDKRINHNLRGMKKNSIIVLAALSLLGIAASCDTLVPEGGETDSKNTADLGLSVKWATCNLGASSPEQSGNFYAWGETTPKTQFTWDNYKWTYEEKSSYGDIILLRSKYNSKSNQGKVDNKTKLDPEDDAARSKLGGKWRMPTKAEFQELIDKCTWTLTSRSGVDGFEVKSKVNDNSIFLPLTGFYSQTDGYDGSTLHHKDQGNLWVSDMDNTNTVTCYFKKGKPGSWWGTGREQGMPIRPVSD